MQVPICCYDNTGARVAKQPGDEDDAIDDGKGIMHPGRSRLRDPRWVFKKTSRLNSVEFDIHDDGVTS